jgi:GT2 family glycosyltransferase
MEKFRLSIIVPVKDNLDITKVCIDSLIRYTEPFQLIVVNEGSNPETTSYLKSIPNVFYIENEKPLGWCKAINQGLAQATGDYVVFANNDTVATPNWAEKMIAHITADTHKLGVLGPVSSRVDGFQHVDHNKEGINFQYADVVTFFFVMVTREVINVIGGLDEAFGLGGQDDADYSIRARKAGFRVGIARDVFIYHYGSATFRNILKNDIDASSKYAESRVQILRDKHRDSFDTGVKKRVMICIPNSGKIIPELATLLINWSHDPRWVMQLYMPKGMFPLDNARNHCVQKFLEGNADYLFWIDDDILPPANCLEKFLTADKDIIGAAAFAMKYENEVGYPYPVTLRYNDEKKYVVHYGQGIEECDATGGACVMFKRKVYETVERPYEFQYYKNGTLALTCDFDVFQKCQKAGFKLFIDFSLVCDHIRVASLRSINNLMLTQK